jgi:hypothetical protein
MLQTWPVSSFANDHDGTTRVVEHGLRDASKQQAPERSKAPSSEGNQVDIATTRNRHDLPSRIPVDDQSLDRISPGPEYRGRVGQHFFYVGLRLTSLVAGLLIRRWRDRPAAARSRRSLQHVQEADASLAHKVEEGQEAKRGARTLRTIDGHQRAPHWPCSTSDDCDRAGRVPCGGQRSTPNEDSFEAPNTAGSECEHVRPKLFRRADDLNSRIALCDKRLHLWPSRPEELGRFLRGMASFGNHAFPQLTHGPGIAGWLRERRHRQNGRFDVRSRSEVL